MTTIRIVCHKLRQANIPHAVKSYDAKSAFHSGTLEDLQKVTMSRLRLDQRTNVENAFLDPEDARIARQDNDFLRQRRFEAYMVIPACDGLVPLRAGEGGLMGDSNEPEAFMHNYYKALRKHTENTYTRHSKPLTASSDG